MYDVLNYTLLFLNYTKNAFEFEIRFGLIRRSLISGFSTSVITYSRIDVYVAAGTVEEYGTIYTCKFYTHILEHGSVSRGYRDDIHDVRTCCDQEYKSLKLKFIHSITAQYLDDTK